MPLSKTSQSRRKQVSLVLTVMLPSTVDGIPGVWQKQAARVIEVLSLHTIADFAAGQVRFGAGFYDDQVLDPRRGCDDQDVELSKHASLNRIFQQIVSSLSASYQFDKKLQKNKKLSSCSFI